MMNLTSPDLPIRVLIIDDHPSLLWGLQKLVESASPHMELAGAANCRNLALSMLERSPVNVALLDIELGDSCGLDIIPDIRRAGAQVIVLSSTRDPRIRRDAIAIGASGFIPKSTGTDEILKAIRHVHEGRLWLQNADIDQLVRGAGRSRASAPGLSHERDQLTAAELRIVTAVAMRRSASNKIIADALNISTHTLRNHLASVYSKLDIHSRLELVLYAQEHHLMQAAR